MVLLISYDLVGHERPASYSAVKAFIEDNARSFRRPLYSQWLVETSASPEDWVDGLIDAGLIDANDNLFVVRIRGPYQGWLPKETYNWLEARVD